MITRPLGSIPWSPLQQSDGECCAASTWVIIRLHPKHVLNGPPEAMKVLATRSTRADLNEPRYLLSFFKTHSRAGRPDSGSADPWRSPRAQEAGAVA